VTDFAGGTGTENDPYLIENKEQLALVANHFAQSKEENYGYFEQIADIDLEGLEWEPLAASVSFVNGYEGNRHKIFNLIADGWKHDYGIFGYINYINISNLNISNMSITTGGYGASCLVGSANEVIIKNIFIDNSTVGDINNTNIAGAFVGEIYIKGEIINCHVTNTNINGDTIIGGLAGSGDNLHVVNCSIGQNCNLTGGWISLGGFFGEAWENTIIEKSSSKATLFSGSAISSVGGFIGGCYEPFEIYNSYCRSDIRIENDSYTVSGIAGGHNGFIAENCYYSGRFLFVGTDYSPLVGHNFSEGEIGAEVILNNCYYNNDLFEEETFDIEIGVTTEEMKTEETFVGWDFGQQPSSLADDYNNGYPELRDTVNGVWWLPDLGEDELKFINPPTVNREMPKANRVTVRSDTDSWTSTIPDTSEDEVVERLVKIDIGSEKVCKQIADRLVEQWSEVQISIVGNVLLFIDLEFKTKVMMQIEDSLIDQEKFILQNVQHDLANYKTTVTVGDLMLDDQELLARILDEIR